MDEDFAGDLTGANVKEAKYPRRVPRWVIICGGAVDVEPGSDAFPPAGPRAVCLPSYPWPLERW